MPDQFAGVLNPEQERAVTHTAGPCLVLAGAGSGKTRVITYRIAWLIQQGIPPSSICGVTFTNKAAAQMRARVNELLGHEPDGLWLLTFHALGLRLLRDASGGPDAPRIGFAVYDRQDSMAVWRACQKKLAIEPREFRPRALFEACSRAVNRLEDPTAWDEGGRPSEQRYAGRIYAAYSEELRRRNAVDFDDLLAWPLRLLASGNAIADPRRFRHFLVDEYQDTNRLQYRLIRALLGDSSSVTVVGDEDQSIYRWRGADIANVLEFERDFPGATVVRLEQNYRSTQPILAAANSLVAHNRERLGKKLWTDNAGDDIPMVTHCADERSEAVGVSRRINEMIRGGVRPREIAVLFRTNAQSRPFEEEFAGRGIPFRVVGGPTFFRRAEVKDLLAYVRLLANDDDDALTRACAHPPRGLGPATVEKIATPERSASRLLREAGASDDPEAHLAAVGVPSRSLAGAAALARTLATIRERLSTISLGDAISAVLRDSGYGTWVKAQPDGADRMANLDELIASASEFGADVPGADVLGAYLDRAALVADADTGKGSRNGVHLITVHAAKGLEFDIVFVVGMEEGVFPHAVAMEEGQVEEERRLAYVAMTRARRRLLFTAARLRRVRGRERIQPPSRFLREIDPRCLRVEEDPGAVAAAARARDGSGRRFGAPASPTRRTRPRPARAVNPNARSTGVRARSSDLREGTVVAHPMFGVGRIAAVQGSGERMKVSVDFARAGTKHLIAKFAKLELVES
jgi:DNA helicase-2/ATP-dependent DNA helicase PcrA